MEFSLYQSTGGRWGRRFCLVQRKIPSAMLNPRGLLGDVLGHATISPCSIFHVWQVEKNPIHTRRTVPLPTGLEPTSRLSCNFPAWLLNFFGLFPI